jgi:Family of unknown function (DUF6152)
MRSFAIFGILIAAASLFAQNGFAATYDHARQVTFKGPVTRIEWTNPQAFIVVNVQDALGVLTSWEPEIGNPLDLAKEGWKPDSVRIGDVVNVDAIPARGTSPQAFAKSVTLTRRGFNEEQWLVGAYPTTSLLPLTERISRPNLRTLSYEAAIDDPGAYINPWPARWTITQTTASKWIPGGEIFEHICEDDAR